MGNTSIFDKKIFNGEVFEGYVNRIENPNRTELFKSRAIRQRPELAQILQDQDGGNYMVSTLTGLISGSAPQNYDGGSDLTANKLATFQHSRVVVGRANAWVETDFSYDITGGHEFIEDVAAQIAEYWEEIDQLTIISILKGVFKMSDDAGAAFVQKHTHDITAVTNKQNEVGKMDATTLNTAMQKACGDNKGRFALAIMHSTVATNLENLNLFAYLKYTDANGIQRDLALGTLNGRTVLVDDGMPTEAVEAKAGVYKYTVGGTVASGDKITVGTVEVTLDATSGASAAAAAAAVAAALGNASAVTGKYTVGYTATNDYFTLTEKEGHVGDGALACSIESTAGTVTKTTTTAPEVDTVYTTYVLGEGSIEYTDCGAKVPYEVERDAAKNGGQDTLYSRQRKCFAPYGVSFTKQSMASASPTDAELETGANWELVSTGAASSKQYINDKVIAIARILSLG